MLQAQHFIEITEVLDKGCQTIDNFQILSRIMSSGKKLKTGSEICSLIAQQRKECSASITKFLSSSKGGSFRYLDVIECNINMDFGF